MSDENSLSSQLCVFVLAACPREHTVYLVRRRSEQKAGQDAILEEGNICLRSGLQEWKSTPEGMVVCGPCNPTRA